jgi:hypothetical protein
MATIFEAICDDFVDDLAAIRSLVSTFSDSRQPAKMRIAAANSATLLVAATFEEFIREMAREYARAVVAGAGSVDKLPNKLAITAWKRTMEGLGKIKLNGPKQGIDVFGAANARFSVVYEFCKGDLSKEIYRDLIHNEMNMRPSQINELFKISGLSDVCNMCSGKLPLLDLFGETEQGKAHGKLLAAMEEFFERRNDIAHSLNPGQSNGPSQISSDIDMLERFGKSLRESLDAVAPPPYAPSDEVAIPEASMAGVTPPELAPAP